MKSIGNVGSGICRYISFSKNLSDIHFTQGIAQLFAGIVSVKSFFKVSVYDKCKEAGQKMRFNPVIFANIKTQRDASKNLKI